jgi:hypothetical protein
MGSKLKKYNNKEVVTDWQRLSGSDIIKIKSLLNQSPISSGLGFAFKLLKFGFYFIQKYNNKKVDTVWQRFSGSHLQS